MGKGRKGFRVCIREAFEIPTALTLWRIPANPASSSPPPPAASPLVSLPAAHTHAKRFCIFLSRLSCASIFSCSAW